MAERPYFPPKSTDMTAEFNAYAIPLLTPICCDFSDQNKLNIFQQAIRPQLVPTIREICPPTQNRSLCINNKNTTNNPGDSGSQLFRASGQSANEPPQFRDLPGMCWPLPFKSPRQYAPSRPHFLPPLYPNHHHQQQQRRQQQQQCPCQLSAAEKEDIATKKAQNGVYISYGDFAFPLNQLDEFMKVLPQIQRVMESRDKLAKEQLLQCGGTCGSQSPPYYPPQLRAVCQQPPGKPEEGFSQEMKPTREELCSLLSTLNAPPYLCRKPCFYGYNTDQVDQLIRLDGEAPHTDGATQSTRQIHHLTRATQAGRPQNKRLACYLDMPCAHIPRKRRRIQGPPPYPKCSFPENKKRDSKYTDRSSWVQPPQTVYNKYTCTRAKHKHGWRPPGVAHADTDPTRYVNAPPCGFKLCCKPSPF